MSLALYKVLHVAGLMAVISALSGLAGFGLSGKALPPSYRKGFAIGHGLGLAVLLISGFGMLARMGYLSSFPLWAMVKLALWLVLGMWLTLIKRKPQWTTSLVMGAIGVATLAVYFALFKPF